MKSGFGLVAALGVLALAIDAGSIAFSADASPRGAAPRRCAPPPARVSDPLAVAQRFLVKTVERKDLPGSYGLAAPSLRHGVSCEQWVKGHVPVARVSNIDWSRSGYKLVAGGAGQVVLQIMLFQPNAKLPAPFLMELRRRGEAWQVGSFQRDETGSQAPTPAA